MKEWELSNNLDIQRSSNKKYHGKNVTFGLLLCFLSGIFSSMLNIGLVFGSKIADEATKLGSSELVANNAVWPIAVGSGFVVNIVYAIYLIQINKKWKTFFYVPEETQPLFGDEENDAKKVIFRAWILSCMMGVLWFGGVILYGLGSSTSLMGDLGPVIGWPMFITAQILTGFFF